MNTCSECEAELPEGAKFCPACGTEVKPAEDDEKTPPPADDETEATEAERSHDEIRTALHNAVRDALGLGDDSWDCWIRDVYDATVVYEYDGKTWQRDYSLAEDDTVTLGDAVQVHVTYAPISGGDNPPAPEPPADDAAAEAAFLKRVGERLLRDPAFMDQMAKLAVREQLDRSTEISGDVVDLVEKAVRSDGSISVKVIQPGWGSSGYYSEDLLENDGPEVFPAGTQMFWDHPTEAEEADRPEGSLFNLAGVTTSDARWDPDGAEGPGLYAEAKVIPAYKEALDVIGQDIGVSIRAAARVTEGEAEGKRGPVVEKLVAGRSIDFVTLPGAGGQVLEVFESARGGRKEEGNMATDAQLREAKAKEKAADERANRAETALIVTVAEKKAAELLAGEKYSAVPQLVKERIATAAIAEPPSKDGQLDVEAFTKALEAKATEEIDYFAKATGSGGVSALGESGPIEGDPEAVDAAKASLAESLKEIGFDEKTAEAAAAGR